MLGDVLGVVLIAQDAQHVAVDVVLVAQVEEVDGVLVPGLGAHDGADDGRIPVVLLHARAGAEGVGRGGVDVLQRALGFLVRLAISAGSSHHDAVGRAGIVPGAPYPLFMSV